MNTLIRNIWQKLVLPLVIIGALLNCQSEPPRPNIIFIMADDHAYQAISAYGSLINQTPNIDRLAQGGIRFEQSFCTNSICAPSRAVLLTGKYSHLNGQINNGMVFDSSQQTFPKLLQEGGYQTAMVGKWHLKSPPTGFDYWIVLPGQGRYYNPDFIEMGERKRREGYATDLTTDIALEWLEKRDKSQPFCMLLHHKAPHRNWMPGPDYLTLFEDQDIPIPDSYFDDYENRNAAQTQEMRIDRHTYPAFDLKLPLSVNTNPDSFQQDSSFWQMEYSRLTDKQRRDWDAAYQPRNQSFTKAGLKGQELAKAKYQRYIKDYLRCVAALDNNIGRVLDYLDKSGLSENTIVVYTSDQGFYLGEHGWFDKRFMYEQSLRVPLIVRYPREIKPAVSQRDMALNLDFAPTFLDYAGLPIPGDMQGRSLRKVLAGKTPDDWRQSIYYHYYEYPSVHEVKRHYGVRTHRYKLIHFYYDIDTWELYDVHNDPYELNNLYHNVNYADLVAELKEELQRLRGQYGDSDDSPFMPQSSVSLTHLALNRPVKLNYPPSAKYTGGSPNALTDGSLAPEQIYYESDYSVWQGFEADDLVATIDLGKETAINEISAGFLQHIRDWIFLPTEVKFAVSHNGRDFETLGTVKNQTSARMDGSSRQIFSLPDIGEVARFVQVHARNLRTCPEWHPGAGGKTWLFVDEIVVE